MRMMPRDHTQLKKDESSICRRQQCPEKYLLEKNWFEAYFLRLEGVPAPCEMNDIISYQRLIWENPPDMFIQKYGNTVSEMAVLCGQGRDGLLMSSHMEWILEQANKKSNDSLCICVPTMSTRYTQEVRGSKSSLSRLIFVVNVGKEMDDSVFIASTDKLGNHWVLVVIELENKTVLYCDSLGWSIPSLLLETLSVFVKDLEITFVEHAKIIPLHVSSLRALGHICANMFKKYPLQSYSNVCGIVAVFSAVMAALDIDFFKTKYSSDKKGFLHNPSKYERHLRRILISWFMNEDIDLFPFKERRSQGLSQTLIVVDHSYSNQRIPLKRKIDSLIFNQFIKTSEYSSVLTTEPSQSSDAVSFIESPQSCSAVLKSKCPHLVDHASVSESSELSSFVSVAESLQLSDDISVVGPSKFSNVAPVGKSSLKSSLSACHVSKNDKSYSSPSTAKKYECTYCHLLLASRHSLSRHKRRKHKSEIIKEPKLGSCYCEFCKDFKTLVIKDLILHYSKCHGQKIEILTKSFHNESDFNRWRKEIETESCTQFKQTCGVQAKGCFQVKYLYCHRSGVKQSVSNGIRRSKGTRMINNKCTAYMTVKIDNIDGSLSVEYCLHHIGHSLKLEHLSIPDETRSDIAMKLYQGVEVGKILDDIKERKTNVDDRNSLITRKDIHNIKHQYNISQAQKHQDDSQSVELWVQEFSKEEDNPIIYYKAQNTPHDILGLQDFILCIQTEFQRSMLLEHASRIICADTTHYKTSQCDFILTAFLVLDEYNEGVPVAWAISNREDSQVLEVFLDAIKHSCQREIITDVFMGDLENNFYNVWCKVFPKPRKILYCSWHVDISWRQKIHLSIESDREQCTIYSFLKELQMEMDEKKFRKMLQDFLCYLKDHAPSFFGYFSQNYVNDNKMYFWARCFHKSSLANTNDFAEVFHHVLKDLFIDGKQNRRVDILLIALLKFSRDKVIDRLTESQKVKGKVSLKLRKRESRERHNASNNVKEIHMCPDGNTWIVSSSKNSGQSYKVGRVGVEQCFCKFRCDVCHVCIHIYSCTCNDFLYRSLSCKHIHAVHMLTNVNENVEETSQEGADDLDFSHSDSVKCKDKPGTSTNIEMLHAGFSNEISKLLDFGMKNNNADSLQMMLSKVKEIVSSVNEIDETNKS